MPKITLRLDRLERVVNELGGGACRLCYGHLMAPVHVMCEPDPHGPGFRETGDRYLVTGYDGAITDDLRCRRCGAEAALLHLMTVTGVGPAPEGRRVCGG